MRRNVRDVRPPLALRDGERRRAGLFGGVALDQERQHLGVLARLHPLAQQRRLQDRPRPPLLASQPASVH